MPDVYPKSFTAFAGHSRIGSGAIADVALAAKAAADRGEQAPILVFDDTTSQQVEIDLRGTEQDVLVRLAKRFPQIAGAHPSEAAAAPRKSGRPKLGVVGREVTLLPRHWDWLAEQPGGASAALRRLIDRERKAQLFNDLERKAKEAAYRFMCAIAGNFPNYEEALRALFAADREAFAHWTKLWPRDVREHAGWLMSGGAAADGAED